MAGVLSLNDRALAVWRDAAVRGAELNVSSRSVMGAQVIDAGVDQLGSLEIGLLLARICLADLAQVSLVPGRVGGVMVPTVAVNVLQPVAACMASQYAGWQIAVDQYFAMGSGPIRALYGKEALFDDIGFREKPKVGVGVLETSQLPDEGVVAHIAGKCGLAPERLTLLCARTASMAGGVQVVARSVETAMHKLHELKFDLSRVVAGYGVAPVPPVAKNDMKAIGRTNDAVLYGGEVTLFVTGDDASIADVGKQLPSSSSSDYGRPFAEIFKRYDHDFYKIDAMLFSPAVVSLQNVETGVTQTFGAVDHGVLGESFFG